MPTLTLKLSRPPAPERLALLARRLSGLSTTVLGKRNEVTAVVIEAAPAGHWFVGARVPQETAALLEIRITQGTNTTAEKEAFIEAAFEELSQQLGPLEEASYVVVQEVPATDWGYGGRTQAARKSGTPVP